MKLKLKTTFVKMTTGTNIAAIFFTNPTYFLYSIHYRNIIAVKTKNIAIAYSI